MKSGIHPEVQDVLFIDRSADFYLLTKSTLKPAETAEYEGKTYPCVYIETSSASHPFYTGKKTLLKTSSLDKFYARQKKSEELAKK
ncbi:type B 50S ribosomal protein L31 [Candidatus Gracilibacteria bacterium]|nr:type B 50S ribosomal protein L31 [Candidatus Gracilibacteria bacterium]